MSLVIVSLSVFGALVLAGVIGYLAGARRKETVTVENENPGYRQPALVQERRDMPLMQRIREMPRSVAALIVALAVLFGTVVVLRMEPTAMADMCRAIAHNFAARYAEVAPDSRGIIMDRFDQPVGDVLDTGNHFVWSNERIAIVDCRFSERTTGLMFGVTVDDSLIGLLVGGSAAFRCSDGAVRRIIGERGGADAWREDAWDSYAVPMAREAFEALTYGRPAAEIYRNREAIAEAVARRMAQSSVVQVGNLSVDIVLPEQSGTEPEPRVRDISGFEFPHLEGWSTSVLSDDASVLYAAHNGDARVIVGIFSSDDSGPEELVRSLAARGDRTYAGRVIHARLGRTTSGDLYLNRAVGDGSVSQYEYVAAVRSGQTGLLIVGSCRVESHDSMMAAVDRIVTSIRPVNAD